MAKADRRDNAVSRYLFGPTGIADVNAPTVAELTALTDITCGIVNQMTTDRSGSQVDIAGLCDMESAEIAGRIQNEPAAGELFREVGTDDYWTLFDDQADPNPVQHLVVARFGFTSGTITAGDLVDVYTVQVGVRSPIGGPNGDPITFAVELPIGTAPAFQVAVVA